MKPAIAREYVFVERKRSIFRVVFLSVFVFAAGALFGDWTADKRFAEREASVREGIRLARAHADRIAESIRNGCYSYVMSKREQL